MEEDLKNKEVFLLKKEEELNQREKQLNEREKIIKEESKQNDKIEKELDEKIFDLNDKLIYMKNKEYLMNIKKDGDENNENIHYEDEDEKELAKIQEELEEELNLENNNNIANTENNDESSLNKKMQQHIRNTLSNININKKINKLNSLSPSNSNKKNINKIFEKNNNNPKNDIRFSLNVNYKRANTISINESENNKFNKFKSVNPSILQTQTKINKSLPSLGMEKVEGPPNLIALIQCFAHIPELSEGLLELGYNKFFKERKDMILLTRNFATIVNNIFFPQKFNNTSRKYNPKIFAETFLKMYPLDNPNGYLSTLKIVKFILDTFHDELNVRKKGKNIENSEKEQKDVDNTNEKEVLVKFLTNLTENNNSLISKLFYGLTKIKCVCNECNTITYSFDYYNFLYFNLLKIQNYKINNGLDNRKSIFLSLNDCLDYYQRAINLSTISLKEIDKSFLEKLSINQNNGNVFCKKCQQEKNCNLYKSIFSANTILPIILERGNDNNYFIEELRFPDELNLEKYVEFNKSFKKYYLCGVVSNYGKNNTYGRFYAYCRMTPNGKWYCYKNENVSSCTMKDVHQNGVPYMLFYHKV